MNNSRRDALAKIQPLMNAVFTNIEAVKAILEDVKAEEDDAYSSASEGKQNGDWGEESQAVTSSLETLIDSIDSLDLSEEMDELSRAIDRDLTAPKGRLTKDEAEKRRMDRLPKWAVEALRRAEEAKEAAVTKSMAKFKAPEEGSTRPVFADYFSEIRGLEVPADTIEFPQVGIKVSYNKSWNKLELHATDMWSLVIRGNASNVMFASAERE